MTYDQKFHKLHFDSIQVLRGIAAILVVTEHIRFLNRGAFGVDIFFCISGFMIMFATYENTNYFYRKRILRIVPFYALMTIVTYAILLVLPGLFEQTRNNPTFLLKSLLFIPFDIGNGVLQPLLRIGWTINCEMFFYLIFGISMKINHKYRGLLCSSFLGVLVVLRYVLPVSFAPLTFYGDPIMLEFILGIVCYELSRRIYTFLTSYMDTKSEKNYPKVIPFMCSLVALIVFSCLIFTKLRINILGFRRLFLWGIPAMVLVLCFFVIGLTLKMPAWTVRLGDISFSLYLVHYYPILLLDRKVFDFSVLSLSALLGSIFGILLVIGMAWIAWLLIEKKFTSWLRKKLIP